MYDDSQRWTIPCCDSKTPPRIIHCNVLFRSDRTVWLPPRLLVFANKLSNRDNSGGFNRFNQFSGKPRWLCWPVRCRLSENGRFLLCRCALSIGLGPGGRVSCPVASRYEICQTAAL